MAERVCCLYRVSTTKQVDHDDMNQADIPVQRKACREFAGKMGWTIVGEEQEAGVSGYKVSADDRDKLQLIKKKAEQGKFDILLVFMFDRLGRKSDETPFVVEWFVKKGIRVWSVNEGEQRFECHTDRLTNYIRYWQADGESQKTSIRTKTALGQMVQDGRFRGGSAPYGYRLAPSGILNKRKHEVYKLEIDEDEARVVRMMFNLCVGSGYGRCKIANLISGQGIQTRTGGNWHEATVGHILHNITYMGILRSGESQSEVFPELQIIDPETFELAQKLMAERVNEYNEQRTLPRNTSGQSMLSGNVFCGHCGGRLTLTTNGTVRKNVDGTEVARRRIRYVCYNKTRHRIDCNGQTGYTMHILDGMVTEILHQIFDRMKAVREDEIVSRTQMNVTTGIKDQLAAAKREFAKATKEYESVKSKLKTGRISKMPRRSKGEGTLYQAKDKSWVYQYRVDGQRKTKRFQRKADAKAFIDALTAAGPTVPAYQAVIPAQRQTAAVSEIMTLGEWMDRWLENYARPAIKHSTYCSYELYVRAHIKPQIGGLYMNTLRADDLQGFFNERGKNGNLTKKGGLAPKTLTNMRNMMHMAFGQAVKNHLLAENLIESVRLPKAPKSEMRVLSREEQRRLMTAARLAPEPAAFGIVFDLFTGLRLGELCGLRWENVDMENRSFLICETRNRLPNHDDSIAASTTVQTVATTKTDNSRRRIFIMDELFRDFELYRSIQMSIKEQDYSYNPEGYVFCQENGSPYEPRTYQDLFKRCVRQAGIPDANFHSLRHTFATRSLEQGMDVVTLSRLLGHANPSITLDKYGHALDDHKRASVAKLGDIYSTRPQPREPDPVPEESPAPLEMKMGW